MEKIIVGYIVPVVSVALTYIFGRLHALQTDKRQAYKEAYEGFYLPFIALLYETQIWDIGFAHLSLNQRHRLVQMILGNIRYMNMDILESVDVLYGHYGMILGKEIFDVNSIITHDRTDEVFDELTRQVLLRAKWLAKKLHQPPLGEFVLELYHDQAEYRERRQVKSSQGSIHNSEEAT